jgi:adenylate cyclase
MDYQPESQDLHLAQTENRHLVVVKGKTETVSVYEVLDYHDEQTFPNVMEVVNHFKTGLAQYRNGDWDRDIGTFRDALKLNEHENICRMYIERCEYLKKHPTKEHWNGV